MHDQITRKQGPNAHDQIVFCAFHSSLVEVQSKATACVLCMRNSNLEIWIAGSPCHPQIFCFCTPVLQFSWPPARKCKWLMLHFMLWSFLCLQNPDDPSSTQKFQELGHAYRRLMGKSSYFISGSLQKTMYWNA